MNCSLLIVASISKWTDMSTLVHNVDGFDSTWKCLVLGHNMGPHAIPDKCNFVLFRNTHWAEIIDISAPIVNRYNCDRHMLVLDDVEIDFNHFNVQALVNYSLKHKLDVVSPIVHNATRAWMRRSCTTNPKYVEIYATLFTRRAWKFFQELTRLVPGVGWGYDICLARRFRSGIDCGQIVRHMGHRSLRSSISRARTEKEKIKRECPKPARAHPPYAPRSPPAISLA